MPKRVFAFKSAVPSSWLNLIENHTHLDPTAEGAGGRLSIKTEDIQTAAITPAKLSTGAPSWTSDGTVSASSFSGAFAGTLTGSVSGNVTGNLSGNASTATALSTASGSAPSYSARAWVNWDGSTGNIRGAGNVSSVTHTATGLHTVNMTVAMPNTLYTVIVSCTQLSSDSSCYATGTADDTIAITTSSFTTRTQRSNGADTDTTYMQAAVFR